jgi:hypothetical protein
MASQTIKAIQISYMEQELLELIKNIKWLEYRLNINNYGANRKMQENELLRLIAKKNMIENKITEGMLLE